MTKDKQIGLRLSAKLLERISNVAEQLDRTKSYIVCKVLDEGLKQYELTTER